MGLYRVAAFFRSRVLFVLRMSPWLVFPLCERRLLRVCRSEPGHLFEGMATRQPKMKKAQASQVENPFTLCVDYTPRRDPMVGSAVRITGAAGVAGGVWGGRAPNSKDFINRSVYL